jgi:6-phosphogluconate dehydrogenase
MLTKHSHCTGGNEWWEETERRQGKCVNRNVHYLGTGVSGGYQSSRHGPSISPSGTPEAYKMVEKKLQKWAAKDGQGKPCVCYVGPGGSGHYVKVRLLLRLSILPSVFLYANLYQR